MKKELQIADDHRAAHHPDVKQQLVKQQFYLRLITYNQEKMLKIIIWYISFHRSLEIKNFRP